MSAEVTIRYLLDAEGTVWKEEECGAIEWSRMNNYRGSVNSFVNHDPMVYPVKEISPDDLITFLKTL